MNLTLAGELPVIVNKLASSPESEKLILSPLSSSLTSKLRIELDEIFSSTSL